MAKNRTIHKRGHASDRRLQKPLHFMGNCLLAGHTHTSKLWQFGRQFVGNSKQFGTFSGNSGCWRCSERATRGNSGPEYFAFYKINKRADDVEENLKMETLSFSRILLRGLSKILPRSFSRILAFCFPIHPFKSEEDPSPV